jgi:hypothetical protein
LNQESEIASSKGFESALGLTFDEYPTFWFYVPNLPVGISDAELMLQDEDNMDVFDQPITIPIEPGLFSFTTRSTGVPLALDKAYHWYFSIICDSRRPSRNLSVDAWIRRVPLSRDFQRQLDTAAEDRKRVELYVNHGIWYEALTLIAKLRCKYPEDVLLINDWTTLLQSIGINEKTAREIAQKPIVQCSRLE